MLPHSAPPCQAFVDPQEPIPLQSLIRYPLGLPFGIPQKRHLSAMANHFSALKRARQTETRTQRNRSNNSRLRSALRDLREALAKGDKAAAQQVFRNTVSALDKAIQKGVLHENTASRYKSRLSARLNALK
jgi:small subunit ribosomal protein S20